jgi:hypothetical protein
MKRWRLQLAMAWLGLATGLAAAENPPLGVPGQIIYPHVQILPPPRTPATIVGPTIYMPPNYPRLPVDPSDPRPLGVLLQRFGVGCWSHINIVGTGSLRSELTFAFGHSRAYFSEPCMHGPQAVPVGQPIPPPNVAPYGVLSYPGFIVPPANPWPSVPGMAPVPGPGCPPHLP